MKQHRQSTFALTLMTVAAFSVTAWANSAVAGKPAKTIKELSEKGYTYNVFRSEANGLGHDAAIVAIVQTREAPGVVHGLVFLQTKEQDHRGKGMVCAHADPRPSDANINGNDKAPPDMSLECHQHVKGYKETLRVGTLDSEFCSDLRARFDNVIKKDPGKAETLYTEGKNPIVTQDECNKHTSGGECVCYQIEHEGRTLKIMAPPNSGSGSGGHN